MTTLLAGLAVFFAVHSFTMFRHARAQMIERLGALPYRGVYSVLALAGFVLIVMGYGDAPRIEIWAPPLWLRYVAMLLLLPVFVLAAAANMPGHIKNRVGNPLLLATKTWAFAHLLVNGDLASMILFGSFLAWAVIDLIAVKRTERSAAVTAPRGLFDVVAVVVGLGIYAAILVWGHVYLSGVVLIAP